MKAAIYNPYWDSLGGGERYSISFAKVLSDIGYKVDVQWNDQTIKRKLQDRFGINLTDINFVKDINKGEDYDVCFWVSDGSIPLLHSRKIFLHFQIPFTNVNGRSTINRLKLFRVNKCISNSYFTKKFIDEEYGVKSVVIYPPVDVISFKPKRKENLILSVGRFSQLTQAKNQSVLVDVFQDLYNKKREWRLVLAGGTDVGVDDYVDKLKKISQGFPVEIVENPDFNKLTVLFGKAKIYWAASGFGIDEEKKPKRVEHFGISVVEAMAAGAVPLIFDAGGHKEIIASGMNGYLWKGKDNLLNKTVEVINDKKLLNKISNRAIKDSKIYEYERFAQEVKDLL